MPRLSLIYRSIPLTSRLKASIHMFRSEQLGSRCLASYSILRQASNCWRVCWIKNFNANEYTSWRRSIVLSSASYRGHVLQMGKYRLGTDTEWSLQQVPDACRNLFIRTYCALKGDILRHRLELVLPLWCLDVDIHTKVGEQHSRAKAMDGPLRDLWLRCHPQLHRPTFDRCRGMWIFPRFPYFSPNRLIRCDGEDPFPVSRTEMGM